jgi:ATP-dependent protease ClpP protease subunit
VLITSTMMSVSGPIPSAVEGGKASCAVFIETVPNPGYRLAAAIDAILMRTVHRRCP